MAVKTQALVPLCVALGLSFLGCGEDRPTRTDAIPPSPVQDLFVAETSLASVTIAWTATGDDDRMGTASRYDLRYAIFAIHDTTWDAAISAEGEPAPARSGTVQSFTVTDLSPSTIYFFALRVADEASNWSTLSNVVTTSTLATPGGDSNWWEGFARRGLDGAVYAMREHNGSLIVGGDFSMAGAVRAQSIAAWDGQSWRPLGEGVLGQVWALGSFNGDLVAGGSFTVAGESSADYVARWDGFAWHPIGDGLNHAVFAIASWNGNLVVGGFFTRAGGIPARYIARWDGSEWRAFPDFDGPIYALQTHGGDLVAGGRFRQAGGTSSVAIARWDGSAWTPLGAGLSDRPPSPSVSALISVGGDLIAGGYFAYAGDLSTGNIARWDGADWNSLGPGMNDEVYALASYGGLVAAGRFDQAGGGAASGAARWNGLAWAPLGSGVGPAHSRIHTAAVYMGSLYVGGDFETAGGKESSRIARWTD